MQLQRYAIVATALLSIVIGTATCRRTLTTPTPPPAQQASPTPTPVPTPIAVQATVSALGSRFSVPLRGAVICCYDPYTLPHGWPLVDIAALRDIANAGGNYTHVRPTTCEASGCGWNDLRRSVTAARDLGIVVEVDILDIWALRNGIGWPWRDETCEVIQGAPHSYHRTWVRDLVSTVGDLPNVIYQVGNESNGADGRCASSLAWEIGIAEAVHAAEQELGLERHLVGTQHGEWEDRPEFDYTTSHRPSAQGAGSKPRLTNEYNDRTASPAFFKAQLAAADSAGTYFALWRGLMDDAEWTEALSYLRTTKGARR